MPIVVLLHDWTPKTAKQVLCSLLPSIEDRSSRRFSDDARNKLFQPEAESSLSRKKERTVPRAVQLALQHLSGARHFGQAPQV
jgi:hypothetical protein